MKRRPTPKVRLETCQNAICRATFKAARVTARFCPPCRKARSAALNCVRMRKLRRGSAPDTYQPSDLPAHVIESIITREHLKKRPLWKRSAA